MLISSFWQIIFEGIRGHNDKGDIAIDDFSLSDDCFTPSCSMDQFTCSDGGCVSLQQRCDWNNDCNDGSDETKCNSTRPGVCSFSTKSACGYTQDAKDQFDWSYKTGSTASTGTGPKQDHTSGNGGYMYIETSSPRKNNDKARLLSPVFKATTATDCYVRFFYHMNGSHINKLQIYRQANSKVAATLLLWSREGSQANEWMRGIVRIPPYSSPFRVVFQGVAGASFTGDIAIDDVSFSDSCYQFSTCSSSNEFSCDNGFCVAKASRCDGTNDCGDNSDEVSCGTCQKTQFKCTTSGKCVSRNATCDGLNQCGDYSDELGCRHCPKNTFQCWRDGKCVAKSLLCNRARDCVDGSDELGCGSNCKAGSQFTCSNGLCVATSKRCDSSNDCSDGSDEIGCSPCSASMFKCKLRSCVAASKVCDGGQDCPKGSDEVGCGDCASTDFRCTNRHCIAASLVCDGKDQCGDNSDESTCTCGDPGAPSNGKLLGSNFGPGAKVTYTCNVGYVLTGSSTRSCLSTSLIWSGAAPSCTGT